MKPKEGFIAVYPGQQVKVLARLVDFAGDLISSSALSAIRLQIFEEGAADPSVIAVVGDAEVTGVTVATSAATETLSTGGGWNADEKGYNFSHTYDISTYLTGGKSYRMEYRITTSSIGTLYVSVNLMVLPTGQAAS